MLWHLRRAGLTTTTFGYLTSHRSFEQISETLSKKIIQLLEDDELVLIGHSLGGVLLRDALRRLPPSAPRPKHLFLLGSPIGPSQLAARARNNLIFRLFARDCGALLASVDRMAAVGPSPLPTTGIVGIRSLRVTKNLFNGEVNDGIVTLTETTAPWLQDYEHVPVVHTFLPSSMRVASLILQRLDLKTSNR
jgi:pimeloyl-ACP methyl ester carboxylesterase